MSDQFKYLLSPLKVGPITVRNRMVISAHNTKIGDPNPRWGEAGFYGERYAHYVAERAKGGVGLIVLGQYAVHPTTRFETPNISIAYDEGAIPGMKLAVDSCHRHGAKAVMQLFHSGFMNTSFIDGTPVWSASDNIPPPTPTVTGDAAKAMEKEDIEELKEYYARCSHHAMLAGADGMEIHAAHGYLLEQFLSPLFNRRTDEYGGSLENRMRLMIEVIETVRNEIGREKVLGLRISADEYMPGGLTLEDMKEVARRLDAHGGINYLNVSQGLVSNSLLICVPPMTFPHGAFVHNASAIRKVTNNVKVMAVGRIVDPVEAEKILADGHADMVIMTRAHIADPEIASKTQGGRLNEIRSCIGECTTCLGPISRMAFQCCTNPVVGREKEWGGEIPLAPKKKRVMVAGGGPGGLEAAWVAAARGHDVTLYEKSGELGGQVLLARLLPTRAEMDGLIRWRKVMVEKHGVKVVLNTEVTPGLVQSQHPDALIIATGSTPRQDGFSGLTYKTVPGWDSTHVVTPEDVLSGTVQAGQNVLVYDVELLMRGLGIAEKLAIEGKSVRLVYPGALPGGSLDPYTQLPSFTRLVKAGVELCPNTLVVSIEGSTVKAVDTITQQSKSLTNVDTLVMVGRATADNSLHGALKGKVPEQYLIGDALAPRLAERAIFEGYKVARGL